MVRDTKGNWTDWAIKLSAEASDALKPLLEQSLKDGHSIESILYIVGDAAHMQLLRMNRRQHKQHKQGGN